MIKRVLVVGGASGIGLSIAVELASRPAVEKVYVVDKAPFPTEYVNEKIDIAAVDCAAIVQVGSIIIVGSVVFTK